ncbi:MAG: hypothetical protein FWH06_03720, partial [Oscillospiraceae bacterium]|nr:hypothetical protein [Oscillospiraceae bacterium]
AQAPPVPAPIPIPVPEPPPDPQAREQARGAVIKAREVKQIANNEKPKPSRLSDRDKEALGRLATKPQKVRFLMSRGLSVEEVARELDIGKGEILLIADLDKT